MGMSKRVDTCVRNVARDEDRDEDGVISRDERERTTHASETRRANEEARSKRERDGKREGLKARGGEIEGKGKRCEERSSSSHRREREKWGMRAVKGRGSVQVRG